MEDRPKAKEYEPGTPEFEAGVLDVLRRYRIELKMQQGYAYYVLLYQRKDPLERRMICGFTEVNNKPLEWEAERVNDPVDYWIHKLQVYGVAATIALRLPGWKYFQGLEFEEMLSLSQCDSCLKWVDLIRINNKTYRVCECSNRIYKPEKEQLQWDME